MSKRMRSGITNTVAALAVALIVSAAAVSIVVSGSLSNRTQVTTITSNKTTTLTQVSTVTLAQGSTTTVTQLSTVTSTVTSVSTVTATTTTSTTSVLAGTGQISVIGQALLASYFTATGTTTTFTCASAPSGAYLTLTNTGTGSISIVSVSITFGGATTGFTLSGSCNFGPSSSATATQYVIFPSTTRLTPSAVTGQAYTGSITLPSGAQVLLSGSWA